LGHPRAAHCGAKVLVKKALLATRSCLTQTGSSGTKAFVHTILNPLPTHLHIIHKSEHNINITCLFALAEKQFVMRALAEWNRSLGDPVSLCILHGLHARRKSLGAEAATNTIHFNYLKSKGVLMNPGCLMRAFF
jgi:hypothetical protein